MSKLIDVYRVEHPTDRIGPYHHFSQYHSFVQELTRYHASLARPNPLMDGCPRHDRGMVYGVKTPELLQEWFDGFWGKMAKLGFVVKHYVVDERDASVGGTQIGFRQDQAIDEDMPMMEDSELAERRKAKLLEQALETQMYGSIVPSFF